MQFGFTRSFRRHFGDFLTEYRALFFNLFSPPDALSQILLTLLSLLSASLLSAFLPCRLTTAPLCAWSLLSTPPLSAPPLSHHLLHMTPAVWPPTPASPAGTQTAKQGRKLTHKRRRNPVHTPKPLKWRLTHHHRLRSPPLRPTHTVPTHHHRTATRTRNHPIHTTSVRFACLRSLASLASLLALGHLFKMSREKDHIFKLMLVWPTSK